MSAPRSYKPLEDARLLDLEMYRKRLTAFCVMAGRPNLAGLTVLAVGSALGGEAFAAAGMGATKVIGLDVSSEQVERAREIASTLDLPMVTFLTFDGTSFPELAPVDAVLSGHVIEHTPVPRVHLRSCVAALGPGGLLFLEFPTRFHHRELHTNRLGFEWLPKPVRTAANVIAGRVAERRGDRQARQDRFVINRTLRQVSVLQVRSWLRQGLSAEIVATAHPSPGVVRLAIRRS